MPTVSHWGREERSTGKGRGGEGREEVRRREEKIEAGIMWHWLAAVILASFEFQFHSQLLHF